MTMEDISLRLYSVAQIRELDRRAMASGIPGYQLMQRAAAACWEAIQHSWPDARRIDVVCGSGNNAGDGFEIARLARAAGLIVKVWQVGSAPARGEALTAFHAWQAEGGALAPLAGSAFAGAEVIVDALFGIGLSRAPAGAALDAVLAINLAHAQGAGVLAVDVPSGLDADSGRPLGAQVHADVTVTFIGGKRGLHAGADGVGQVLLADLDIPESAHAGLDAPAFRFHERDLRRWLMSRRTDAHKGCHGHVLLVGGNAGMSGAILLAARAALRAGAGLVSVATRASHAAWLAASQPELMCHGIERASDLTQLLQHASVVAMGPGLGQDEWSRSLYSAVIESDLPLVVDADALNLLAHQPARSERWVLTPHPGEAARLLGCSTAEIQRDRFGAVTGLYQRYGGVVVLKGAGSLIQGAVQRLCPYGNPGMAVGGMGDVLTGIIAAFIGQGLALEDAAGAGVLAHALAGDRAAQAGQRGLLPSDLIAELRAIVNP
ncbi:MAG: NAD(P)H-hydrate dehydratase [Stenotrophobium sp.]